MKFMVYEKIENTSKCDIDKWLILIDRCRRWEEGRRGQENASWRTTRGQLPNPEVHSSTSHWGMSEFQFKPFTKVECQRS